MPTSADELRQVEKVIADHPDVARVRVRVEEDDSGTPSLVAYVAPKGAEGGTRTPGEEDQRVSEWNLIYEWVYGELPESGGFGDNFVGWHSTYTGDPIALEEMREWRDATVGSVLELRPRSVLEIGVGTGLLMARLAPACESYTATDFSPTVIQTLTEQVAAEPGLAGRVTLLVREADDLSGIEGGFDTVVINSVIQYFPGGAYLEKVLTQALALVRPGGAVFVGDVRNQRLHRSFRTAVLAEDLTGASDADEARARVEHSVLDEKELLVDPAFFTALRRATPDLAAVDLRLKRARHHNELSRHRYDVVLHKAPAAGLDTSALPTLVWGTDVSGTEELRTRLGTERPDAVRVVDVPNARVWHEVSAARLLDGGAGTPAVLAALAAAGDPAAVDPEDFGAPGYQAVVSWAVSGAPGRVDVVLVRDDAAAAHRGGAGERVRLDWAPTAAAGPAPAACTNNPARATRTSSLVAALRADLAGRLPGHLMPRTFLALDDSAASAD